MGRYFKNLVFFDKILFWHCTFLNSDAEWKAVIKWTAQKACIPNVYFTANVIKNKFKCCLHSRMHDLESDGSSA